MQPWDQLDRIGRGEEPAPTHQREETRIRLRLTPQTATVTSARATRTGNHDGVVGGDVLLLGKVPPELHATAIVVWVLAGGLETVTVAVPHPVLPAEKRAWTAPFESVVAVDGWTVAP
jgi:hypothetical protein